MLGKQLNLYFYRWCKNNFRVIFFRGYLKTKTPIWHRLEKRPKTASRFLFTEIKYVNMH